MIRNWYNQIPHQISKTFWASGLKFGHPIGYDEQITFEQILFFFSWVTDLCKGHFNLVSKTWARGLKLGQLIGDDEEITC